ncbi:hypothetical protein ACWCYY_16410 [Kitasatospora sp. NPDC001664]
MITGASVLARLHALAARVPYDPRVLPGARLPVPAPAEVAELVGRIGGFTVPPVEFTLTGHPRQGSDHGLPEPHWVVSDGGGGGLTWVDLAHRVPESALIADLRAAAPGSRARFDRHLPWYRLVRATDAPVFAAVPRDPS